MYPTNGRVMLSTLPCAVLVYLVLAKPKHLLRRSAHYLETRAMEKRPLAPTKTPDSKKQEEIHNLLPGRSCHLRLSTYGKTWPADFVNSMLLVTL
jgi:hypothetical protein